MQQWERLYKTHEKWECIIVFYVKQVVQEQMKANHKHPGGQDFIGEIFPLFVQKKKFNEKGLNNTYNDNYLQEGGFFVDDKSTTDQFNLYTPLCSRTSNFTSFLQLWFHSKLF